MIPDENLQRAAKLVEQERNMLLRSHEKLERIYSQSNTVDVVKKNVYLESFLLHYRNILDFLAPRDLNKKHDVKADDFLPGYKAHRPPTTYRDAIDKRLAHVSYKRLDVQIEEEDWQVSDMLNEIGKTWKHFVDRLKIADPHRSTWFGPQTPEATNGESFVVVSASRNISASTSATDVTIFDLPPS